LRINQGCILNFKIVGQVQCASLELYAGDDKVVCRTPFQDKAVAAAIAAVNHDILFAQIS